MPLYFIRESGGAFPDQPFFSEAVHYAGCGNLKIPRSGNIPLAAVIGHPAGLSATPAEQNDFFFKQRGIPVLSIPLKEEELTKEGLRVFQDLGFVFFAVTSPLKQKAFALAARADQSARQMRAANTLILRQGQWMAFNTDIEGFASLKRLKGAGRRAVAVWGGGGVRPVLRRILPSARFYSARTGREIPPPAPAPFLARDLAESSDDGEKLSEEPAAKTAAAEPEALVWAVGRKRMEQGCLWPPADWAPRRVIDLNYSEDSPGREYALKTRAAYQSGWDFFKRQAAKQRELFARLHDPV